MGKEFCMNESDGKETDSLPSSLEGYKEKIATENKGSLSVG